MLCFIGLNHRYRRAKIDCLSFAMCPLLAQLIIGFFSFLQQPFTVLMKKTRVIKQSIFLDVYGLNKNLQAITHFWQNVGCLKMILNDDNSKGHQIDDFPLVWTKQQKNEKKMFQKQSLYRVIYIGHVCCENASKRENVMLT